MRKGREKKKGKENGEEPLTPYVGECLSPAFRRRLIRGGTPEKKRRRKKKRDKPRAALILSISNRRYSCSRRCAKRRATEKKKKKTKTRSLTFGTEHVRAVPSKGKKRKCTWRPVVSELPLLEDGGRKGKKKRDERGGGGGPGVAGTRC